MCVCVCHMNTRNRKPFNKIDACMHTLPSPPPPPPPPPHAHRLVVRELFSDDVSTKSNPSDGLHSNQEKDEEEEDGYFSTYSHFSIHEEMLKVRF